MEHNIEHEVILDEDDILRAVVDYINNNTDAYITTDVVAFEMVGGQLSARAKWES